MKKILKSPLTWVCVAVILVAVIVQGLWVFGFRITYDPNIVTDWNAVGATASWVSAIATILIPIAVVYIQHKLDKNKHEIGEANKALLAEVKEFMDAWESGKIILDGEGASMEVTLETTEERVLNYINATMSVTKDEIVKHFGITEAKAISILNSLVKSGKVIHKSMSGKSMYIISK